MVELSTISQLTAWSRSLVYSLLSLSNRTLFWCIWLKKSCVSHASLFQHFELVLVRYRRVALSVAVLAVAVYSSHVPHCAVSWKVAHMQAKYHHETKWYCSILTSLDNYMVSIYSCGGGRWLKSTRTLSAAGDFCQLYFEFLWKETLVECFLQKLCRGDVAWRFNVQWKSYKKFLCYWLGWIDFQEYFWSTEYLSISCSMPSYKYLLVILITL